MKIKKTSRPYGKGGNEPKNAYVVRNLKTDEDEVIYYEEGATIPKRARSLKGHNYYIGRPMEKGLSKVTDSIKKRDSKVRVPTIKARPGPTKVKPTKKELEMDRQLRLQDKAPNVYKMIEKGQTSNKMGGGKVKSPVVNKLVGGLIKEGAKAIIPVIRKAVGKGKEKVKRGVDKALHYSADQGTKGAPGVMAGGRTSKSAVIGRKHVADYTRRRRAEGLKAGVPVGAGGSVLVDSMYDSKKKSKKAPSLGGKRQTEADRRKAILKKVQTPVDTVGGISKPKKKAAKAPLPKKKPIRLKKPKEGKSDSSVTVDYSVIDKLKSGGKVKGYKKGGPITYRMSGGQVVGNSYD